MRERTGNLWDFHDPPARKYVVITTNGAVKRNGACVMGRGVAAEAKRRFPHLDVDLGVRIKHSGNHVYWFSGRGLFSFPVKVHWSDPAELHLVEQSAKELVRMAGVGSIYLPRPGCGNGRLNWDDVKPVIAPILDDRFTVVELG